MCRQVLKGEKKDHAELDAKANKEANKKWKVSLFFSFHQLEKRH